MKRRLLIIALGLGTFLGFASGFASMGAGCQRHHEARRAAFEQHVADVCVDAARRAERGRAASAGEAPADHADMRHGPRYRGADYDW